ncbi:sulfurtransferase [Pseudoalteromonas sp. MMG024]|uniref:sulfurtransferase n=1 Tax=Pseudoalteromonas sp. MMG024 TaxID=2909980 RepID=UPI001F209B33|nr:sulfurtransferase [Pseudoalteromonas sp. MMG024]MCF6458822.1 sulfurtransferase [Pseudoalteromonas sp. MMG024]
MTNSVFDNTDFQVDCTWLKQHLDDTNLVVLDASMDNPVNKSKDQSCGVIPGTIRFDFSKCIADVTSASPNTMPSAHVFEDKIQQLGINQDSHLVVYDKQGLFSAARAWFMFKTMGFDNVAILRGGLPAWQQQGFDVVESYAIPAVKGNFKVQQDKQLFVDKHYVLNAINNDDIQIVDARGYGRFSGQEAEPREGMRSGHIPNSLNLHYASLLEQGGLLDKATLKQVFNELVPAPKEFIFSCGSGVTACILALAAEVAGFDNVKVYDGSWSEWGKDKLLPIDTVSN